MDTCAALILGYSQEVRRGMFKSPIWQVFNFSVVAKQQCLYDESVLLGYSVKMIVDGLASCVLFSNLTTCSRDAYCITHLATMFEDEGCGCIKT